MLPGIVLAFILTSHGVVSGALPLHGAVHFGARGPLRLPPLPRPRRFPVIFPRFSGFLQLLSAIIIALRRQARSIKRDVSACTRVYVFCFRRMANGARPTFCRFSSRASLASCLCTQRYYHARRGRCMLVCSTSNVARVVIAAMFSSLCQTRAFATATFGSGVNCTATAYTLRLQVVVPL